MEKLWHIGGALIQCMLCPDMKTEQARLVENEPGVLIPKHDAWQSQVPFWQIAETVVAVRPIGMLAPVHALALAFYEPNRNR